MKKLDSSILNKVLEEFKIKNNSNIYLSLDIMKLAVNLNLHKKNQCILAVPFGKVIFTFAKNINSKKKNIIIGKNKYSLIIVPPGNWFKFKSLDKISLVVNTLDNIHSDNETQKLQIK